MNKSIVVILVALLTFFSASGKDLMRFSIQQNTAVTNQPVSILLEGIDYNPGKNELVLFELTRKGRIAIPFQIDPGPPACLWFIRQGMQAAGSRQNYVLALVEPGSSSIKAETLKLSKKDGDLLITRAGQAVLSYRYGMSFPPAGVESLYMRSGFIHPLWSPAGEVLTRIQPPDHYHHYGIWGPWTLTFIGEREVDFWNLAKGQGTVRFENFISEWEGPVHTGFKALQQHIDFGNPDANEVALNEVLEVRVWSVPGEYHVIDYNSTFTCPLPGGILFDAYRYGGGIGFRATGKWHKANSTVLTSEGKTRVDADGTYARWCIVEGESGTADGRSGILFMSHPSNRAHPEPMRVWPEDANNNRGDLFFEFTPIRYEAWKIEPYRPYSLRYRMVVFDGKMDAEKAEKLWNAFARVPEIRIEGGKKN